jgi:hypothetical protein
MGIVDLVRAGAPLARLTRFDPNAKTNWLKLRAGGRPQIAKIREEIFAGIFTC